MGTILSTSCAICQLALCFVFVCIQGLWKAVGCVVLHGHVVHVDVLGEVMLWIAAT